jgi:hypothetical protein
MVLNVPGNVIASVYVGCFYIHLLYFIKFKPINYFVFSYVGTEVHIPIFLLEVIPFFFKDYSTVFLCFLEIFQYSQEKICILSRIFLFSLGNILVFYRKYSCFLQNIFLYSLGNNPLLCLRSPLFLFYCGNFGQVFSP